MHEWIRLRALSRKHIKFYFRFWSLMSSCLSLWDWMWLNVCANERVGGITPHRLCICAIWCHINCISSLMCGVSSILLPALRVNGAWKILILTWISRLSGPKCLCCWIKHRPLRVGFFNLLLFVSYDWTRIYLLLHLLFCRLKSRSDFFR